MTRLNPHTGRIAAGAVFAIGLAGTVNDPDGVVGVTLFGAAAAALLYLVAPLIVRLVAGVARRPGVGLSPRRVRLLVGPRTLAGAAFGAGALLGATTLFDANGDAALERVLSDATFLGGFALVAAIALVMLATALRWTRRARSA